MEVIQKIKVNSRDEVHLFLRLPRKISALPLGEESLGSTLQNSAEERNCQLDLDNPRIQPLIRLVKLTSQILTLKVP